MISLLVAVSENGVIGKDNQLPWHLPADLKYFKAVTMGHPIIMGRKTHESIGKPLPGRPNIIITRQKDYSSEGCIIVNSISEAIKHIDKNDEAFIIGGAEIFNQSIDLADRLYFTRIHSSFEGDAFFPDPDKKIWKLIKTETHSPDEKNKYSYSFMVYEKVAPTLS